MALLTVQTSEGPAKVTTRWNGNNLAVHSSMVSREDLDGNIGQVTKNDNFIWHYTITHKATGLRAAKFLKKDLNVALLIAKQFDNLFHYNNSEQVHSDEEFVKEWKDVVAKYKGKVG
jgi:hypothetical protein